MSDSGDITVALSRLARGEEGALSQLLPTVYEQLRSLAHDYFGRQPPDHTLQPTALVHEAFLKLVGGQNVTARDSAHFFALAATVMRQILVDHARRRRSDKRGGDRSRVPLEQAEPADRGRQGTMDVDLLELHDALERLAAHDRRKSRVVELRVFGGLTCEQTAQVLGIPSKTAEADWYMARAWLRRELAAER